ncbi:phosphate signaling complex protein PhoU [Clostridium sp.]|uniref:phosphate signaling complex protein PhoU n=1 Tax=Clostridium sp. TaxID=1506 RepID=UPI002A917525|nr:phosphate signaling complex protein PhoU [Clostridium sp.]MDY6012854.1 phosphate signaling complex protein PhoU [Clostridium sp.]
MIRKSQALKINIINNNLKEMINLVNDQLHQSMMALKNLDVELADKTIKSDDLIDELQKKIEEECIKFIATERPVAKDLRRVFTASKIVTDLERMADLAVDICKIAKKSDSETYIGEAKKLWIMEQRIRNMLNLAMEAYLERDAEKAYEICKLDDEIDNIYKEVFKDTLLNIKKEEGEVKVKTNLLFVSKYLERMGDHVTNICEWIIFSKKGKYVDLNE